MGGTKKMLIQVNGQEYKGQDQETNEELYDVGATIRCTKEELGKLITDSENGAYDLQLEPKLPKLE